MDAPRLEPELVAEQDGLRAEVYKVEFRAGFWTRLAMLRAWFWGRLGVDSLAARAAREVIPAIPGSPWLVVWAGQMLAKHGEREEACAVYCELQKLPPGDPEAYATLGRYLMSVGRHGRAAGFLSEAVRLRPLDPELRDDYQAALSAAAVGVPRRRVPAAIEAVPFPRALGGLLLESRLRSVGVKGAARAGRLARWNCPAGSLRTFAPRGLASRP